MNHCMLMAEIVEEPQLRYTAENLMVSEMMVQFSGLRENDAPEQLRVIGWGNLAQDIQQNYHSGDRVVLEGRLGINSFDHPQGFKEKRAELTVQRIHRLSADGTINLSSASEPVSPVATSPRPAAAPPPSGRMSEAPVAAQPPAAPPTPDYDDIPFVRPVESMTAGINGDLIDCIDQDIHRPRVGFEFHKF